MAGGGWEWSRVELTWLALRCVSDGQMDLKSVWFGTKEETRGRRGSGCDVGMKDVHEGVRLDGLRLEVG